MTWFCANGFRRAPNDFNHGLGQMFSIAMRNKLGVVIVSLIWVKLKVSDWQNMCPAYNSGMIMGFSYFSYDGMIDLA